MCSEWPTKLYTISYILYPFIGSAVTIGVGVVASLLLRSFISKPRDSCYNYLHPLAMRVCCIAPTLDEDEKNSSKTGSNNNVKAKCDTNGHGGIDNHAFEMKNV